MTNPLPPSKSAVFEQRGWTMEDMETAMKGLPDPDDAGLTFKRSLLDFCSVFLPFGFELRRLLMIKLGLMKYMKIKKAVAALGDAIGPRHPDWDHCTNAAYRTAVTALGEDVAKAFPARMDKILQCKQRPGERVRDFYERFEALYSLHSGLEKPNDLGSEMGIWEGGLKAFLMNGLRADLRDKIEESCVGDRLRDVLGHAYRHDDAQAAAAARAEREAEETKRRAEVALMNAVAEQLRSQSLSCAPRGGGRGGGRGRGRGAGRYRAIQTVKYVEREEEFD